MIISDEFSFVYVHIPKSGGTSISSALENILGKKDRGHWAKNRKTKHETILELRKRNRNKFYKRKKLEQILNEYYFFGIVRNPWDRVVSFYHYLKKTEVRKEIQTVDSFEQFVHLLCDPTSWLQTTYGSKLQLDYLVDEKGNVRANFIGRFERLQDDFNFVMNELGVDPIELPHMNKAQHSNYREYFSKNLELMVRHKFQADIDYFKYKF